jgi:hypothetical protein
MGEEPQELPEEEVYRLVLVFQGGREFAQIMRMSPRIMQIYVDGMMSTGSFREVRFERLGPATVPVPRWPPEMWVAAEPLEIDTDLPPLDRPKIP